MGILLYSVFNASNVDSLMKRLYTSLVRLHLEQEFIKRFLAEIIKMYGWGKKLLANKVHIQGMEIFIYCMADKVHKQEPQRKNQATPDYHNVWLYITSHMQPSLHK